MHKFQRNRLDSTCHDKIWQGVNFWSTLSQSSKPSGGWRLTLTDRENVAYHKDGTYNWNETNTYDVGKWWKTVCGAEIEDYLFICSWLMTCFPYIYKDSKQKKGKPVLNEQGSSSINGAPTNWSWLQLVLACWTHSSECPIAGQYSFVYL